MRRSIALAAILVTLTLSCAACSQPIDTGSPVPAQAQPLTALLALVGIGIALTALHHHDQRKSGGGGGANLQPAAVVRLADGSRSIDLAVDVVSGTAGILQARSGNTPAQYVQVSAGTIVGSYSLPPGYDPTALALDAGLNEWFVDATGNIDYCPAPASGTAACTPTATVSDGLGPSTTRSIAADSAFALVAVDNGSGTVAWTAFSLGGGSPIRGSYSYAGRPLYPADAMSQNSAGGISSFILFHQDGASYQLQFPSTTTKQPFALAPPPASAPANVADQTFYGLLGSPSGLYQIGRYFNDGTAASLAPQAVIDIASGGQTANNSFSVPLRALRADSLNVSALDRNGNLIQYAAF
ncbi:MAG: hypothetical protein M3T49_00850 [Candidatus Eremiobacteraeota bacterium]|nr:hypothetical protein [Candidatus Eremiobacteraeota bacterium]